jgi:hypothetical protein
MKMHHNTQFVSDNMTLLLLQHISAIAGYHVEDHTELTM